MRRLFAAAVAASLLFAMPAALADATLPVKDVPKSKDHPQVPRYDGALIVDYDYKAYDEVLFPLSVLEPTGKQDGMNNHEMLPKKSLDLEGARTRIVYLVPEGRSPLEVLRNYPEAIAAKGGQKLYECKEAECGGDPENGVDHGGSTQSLLMHTYPKSDYHAAPFTNASCALTSNVENQRFGVMKF